MRYHLARALALLACVLAQPAQADDCKPLAYYTGVPITLRSGALLVPVTLNQKPEMVMFDSGGIASQLTRATVKNLGLTEQESPLRLLDISGNMSTTLVRVENFEIGALKVNRLQFQVSTLDALDKDNIAGLLSSNFMRAFDVDLDFGSGRMNFFLPDHCAGKVVYWPTDALAAVPITLNQTHIVVPVTIDGNRMTATIDTGASLTTMNMFEARRLFGLTPDTPDMPAVDGHLNGDENLAAYRHTFGALSFEGVTVKNPSMIILPDRVNSKEHILTPGSHLENRDVSLPEMIIGLDILQKLHLYISYNEHMLYVTPADAKAGKLLPVLASPAAEP